MPDDTVSMDSEYQAIDKTALRIGLKEIRRRRWYLWTIILVYLPLMGMAMTYRVVSVTFACWFFVMLAIAIYAAVSRCPRCGNYFHMHGMTLLYYRKCLHCQLHVSADKRF